MQTGPKKKKKKKKKRRRFRTVEGGCEDGRDVQNLFFSFVEHVPDDGRESPKYAGSLPYDCTYLY
jgi:hypothetical protein